MSRGKTKEDERLAGIEKLLKTTIRLLEKVDKNLEEVSQLLAEEPSDSNRETDRDAEKRQ